MYMCHLLSWLPHASFEIELLTCGSGKAAVGLLCNYRSHFKEGRFLYKVGTLRNFANDLLPAFQCMSMHRAA